jgi:undecaprenyl diphosphate synthase
LSDAARSRSGAEPVPQEGGSFEVPRHVAIIMDGNGRWAAARGLPRVEGHRRGVEALRRTVRAAGDLGISVLTIFSFSSENWSRPPSEISDLMGLLRRFIRKDLAELHNSNVRVRIIGERDDLDREICLLLQEAEDLTRDNDGLTLVVAFNYGARQEIAQAARPVVGRRRHAGTPRQLLPCAGHSRSRRDHPHQRRAAAFQLSALAGGL